MLNIIQFILEKAKMSKREVNEKTEEISILDRVFNDKSSNEQDLSLY